MKAGKRRSKEFGKMQGKNFCKRRKKGCSSSSSSDSGSVSGSVSGSRSVSSNSSCSDSSNSGDSNSGSENVMGANKNDYRKEGPAIKHRNINTATTTKKPDTQEGQKTKSSTTTSFEVSSAGIGNSKHNTSYNFSRYESVQLVKTQPARAIIAEDITSIIQLQWYRIQLGGTREILKPCRVLSRGDASKLHSTNQQLGNMNEKTLTIQYLTFPDADKGLYKRINESTLVPFGCISRDGLSTTFNDDYLELYMQQEGKNTNQSKLEATRLFLKRVFDHAQQAEKKSRDQANKDLQDCYDDCSVDSDNEEVVTDCKRVQFEAIEDTADDEGDSNQVDDLVSYDDLDVPYTQTITFDPDDFGTMEEKSNEPIRPGDLIEYYSPIFVAGDARGLRRATVLAVDPKRNESPLTLSNGEGIPNNTKLKRIKVMLEGELVDHPGIFRPIYRFKLTKQGSATAANAIAMEASRFERIMHKNTGKLEEKARAEGFAPMDLLVNRKRPQAECRVQACSKTILSAAATFCGNSSESMLSPSDYSNNNSDDDCRKSKQNAKPQCEKARNADTRVRNHSKENNGTALGDDKRMSFEPLSLGPSLASSSDGSIESDFVKGKNHTTITQHERFASFTGNEASRKSQDDAVTLQFSLSNDDDNKSPKKTRREKCKTSSNRCSSGTLTSESSSDTEGLLETPSCSGLRKKPSSPSPSTDSHNSSAKQSQVRRKSLPSSSSSHETSTSSKLSRRLGGKQAEADAETNSSILFSRRLSSDYVQTVNGNKLKLTTKKSLLPPADFFSSSDSDDSYHSEQNGTVCSNSITSLLCEHSYSLGSKKLQGAFLSKHSSSDSVEIVEEARFQLSTKKRPPPLTARALSEASDSSSCHLTKDKTYRSKSKKAREKSPDSTGLTRHNENNLAQKLSTTRYLKNASSFGCFTRLPREMR